MEYNEPDVYYSTALRDYSSEYGISNGQTYDASNITGHPSNLHFYGDHVSSLVFRTYGRYWKSLPYHKEYKLTPCSDTDFEPSDFIEVEFPQPVHPTGIKLFETFCPGGLVRVLVCNHLSGGKGLPLADVTWHVVWKKKPVKEPHVYMITDVEFSNPVQIPEGTRIVRLEFNGSLAEYYHELDAVAIVGELSRNDDSKSKFFSKLADSISDAFKGMSVNTNPVPKSELSHELEEQLVVGSNDGLYGESRMLDLPLELIRMILSYITDLNRLFEVALVCRAMYKIVYDPFLIQDLNLKPYYSQLKGSHLKRLTENYSLSKLNLSWTGICSYITAEEASESIKNIGPELQTLVCRNARTFIGDLFLKSLASTCKNLTYLDLFRCQDVGLPLLAPLVHLEFLNISQCRGVVYKEAPQDDSFFARCRNIRWFMAGRSSRSNMFLHPGGDFQFRNLVIDMMNHCKEIRGVSFWRQLTIRGVILDFIRKFGRTLKYLDLGWTGNGSGERFWPALQECCPNLEVLCLTSVSIQLDDATLQKFRTTTPNLEQLDLLGVRGYTRIGLEALLDGCKNMRFMDLSYTDITRSTVLQLREKFPHCDIKHVPAIMAENEAILDEMIRLSHHTPVHSEDSGASDSEREEGEEGGDRIRI